MKAGEGRVKDFLKVILREAKGFLAEDREDQVWSLATMWKRVVRGSRLERSGAVRRQGLGGCDPGDNAEDGSKARYKVKSTGLNHMGLREREMLSDFQEGKNGRVVRVLFFWRACLLTPESKAKGRGCIFFHVHSTMGTCARAFCGFVNSHHKPVGT